MGWCWNTVGHPQGKSGHLGNILKHQLQTFIAAGFCVLAGWRNLQKGDFQELFQPSCVHDLHLPWGTIKCLGSTVGRVKVYEMHRSLCCYDGIKTACPMCAAQIKRPRLPSREQLCPGLHPSKCTEKDRPNSKLGPFPGEAHGYA